MNFTGDIRTKRLLLFVMSSCCMIFGTFTLIFKEKIFATILNSVSVIIHALLYCFGVLVFERSM